MSFNRFYGNGDCLKIKNFVLKMNILSFFYKFFMSVTPEPLDIP